MSLDHERALQEDRQVVEALLRIGLHVQSVYDLVNTRQSYAAAIPVLIDWLPRARADRIKEGVARALTVKEARPAAAGPLIAEFRRLQPTNPSEEQTKWAVGNALAVVADDGVFQDIVELVTDPGHGWARSMLPLALCRMPEHRQQAIAVLLRLLRDEDVVVGTMKALVKLKARAACSDIEQHLAHPNPVVRKVAVRTLASLSKLR